MVITKSPCNLFFLRATGNNNLAKKGQVGFTNREQVYLYHK